MKTQTPLKNVILVPVFAAMTVVGAYIAVPLPWSPVPIVLQNFFILLAGLVLGSRKGAAAAGLYILLGALGLPVFAGGTGGIAVFAGPTAGYLLSYPAAAGLVGCLKTKTPPAAGPRASRSASIRAAGRDFTAALAGVLLIHAAGVPWLKARLAVGWEKAVIVGFLPFIAGDLFKAVAAALLARTIRHGVQEEGLDGTA